jgi:hypothetical protein
MPKVDRYQLYPIGGWPKGFVRNADHFKLFNDELFVAQNFKLDARGELVARDGYIPYSGSSIGSPVLGLIPWKRSNGIEYLIAVDDTSSLWSQTAPGGGWTDSTDLIGIESSFRDFGHAYASAGDKLYISSLHVTNPYSFDGTTWSTNTAIAAHKTLLYRHQRLMAGNSAANPQRILFSNVADPETFDALDFIDVAPKDGEPIMHMVEFGDNVIIFKENSIWQLTGRTPATFQLYQLDNARGCVSPKSVVVHNGILYFFDRQTGVWSYNGATFTWLSESINEYLLEQLHFPDAYNAAAYVRDNRYYLGVNLRNGVIANRKPGSFVFSTVTSGWTEYTTRFLDSVEIGAVRYNCGQAREDDQTLFTAIDPVDEIWEQVPGAIQSQQPSPSSIGTVDAVMETGWIQLGGPGMTARVRRVEFKLEGDGVRAFTVEMFRDFDSTNAYVTRANLELGDLSYSGTDPDVDFEAGQRIVTLDGWGNRINVVKFRFTASSMSLSDFHIFYTGGANLRGERHSAGVGGQVADGKD